MNSLTERITGCLLGGVLGDAFGYPVRFSSWDTIEQKFGTAGILAPLRQQNTGISDVTQLTLFTAEGLIHAAKTGRSPVKSVYRSYLQWLYTQDGGLFRSADRGLLASPEIYMVRARPETTHKSLHSGGMGSRENRINTSKAADGMMRAAPAGLAAEPQSAFTLGEEIAALTHGHPDGYLSAGAFAFLISEMIAGKSIGDAAAAAVEELETKAWSDECTAQLKAGMELASSPLPDRQAIGKIGSGKTGERALAIGVFCALRYPEDVTGGLRAAVNHGGDSSVTASVTGQILGASLGEAALPDAWMKELELTAIIRHTGEMLTGIRGMI